MGQRIPNRRINDNNNRRVDDHDEYHDDDKQFLDYLNHIAARHDDNNDTAYYLVDDRTYNYIVNLYATAIDNDPSYNNYDRTNNYDRRTTASTYRPTTNSGDNNMAANYGIHTPDDDAYYHCSRNDCPCNDTNTVHVDLDRILDRTCGHDCCDTATCDCACCDRACDSCS